MDKTELRAFYEENVYGIWRDGECVTYRCLGEDPKAKENTDKPRNPFEIVGGELIEITAEKDGRSSSFIVHAFLPTPEARAKYPNGSPFIICLNPIMPVDYILSQGYALFFMDCYKIASDDINRKGAFYDLYPYGCDEKEQTGVLMAWAWGAAKVLDAVYSGLGAEKFLDPLASMVTGVSRFGKATAVCGAFDERFKMTIPSCSGAGGLALYSCVSEGNTYDFGMIGGPSDYTYTKNEPLDCLQSDSERGWFVDRFLQYKTPSDIPYDQENLVTLAMNKDRYYFIIASYMGEDWVNAPAMWECFKRADSEYEKEGLRDNLAVHFHKEGHAVLEEDARLFIPYFDHMYYGTDPDLDLGTLKTTVFEKQKP